MKENKDLKCLLDETINIGFVNIFGGENDARIINIFIAISIFIIV